MNNWDQLKIYLAVARNGTVSAAARSLGVSHATVLRRIDQFEEELGTKLFKRLQSGYQLSEEGRALLDKAIEVETATQEIKRRFDGNDQQLSGTLRVTQPENEVIDLYPLYAKFIQLYPDISLEIISSSEVSNLNRQDADVAIRFTNQPDDLLIGHCLGPVHFGAYASQSYLAQFKKTPKMKDCRWIVWQGRQSNRDRLSQLEWIKRRVKEPEIVMRTSSVSDIISAIRASIGVGFISHPVAAHYSDLQALDNAQITSTLKLWILTHRDLRKVARIKCFIQFMREEVSQHLNH